MTTSKLIVITLAHLCHLVSVSAAAWSSSGQRVVGCDPDPELRDAGVAGHGPVSEPGIVDALIAVPASRDLAIVGTTAAAMAGVKVTHLGLAMR